MRGRPIVPHCPLEPCRARLRDYNFYTQYGSRPMQARGRRPSVPTQVEPAQTRQRRVHGRVVVQAVVRCPDCGHEWWSTTADRPYR